MDILKSAYVAKPTKTTETLEEGGLVEEQDEYVDQVDSVSVGSVSDGAVAIE